MTMFSKSSTELEPSLGLDVELQLLVVENRPRADTSDRSLHVLRLNGVDDVGDREIEAGQALGLDPGAHGVVLGRKQERVADAGRALDRIQKIDRDVVRQEKRIVRPFWRIRQLRRRGSRSTSS